MRITEQVRSQFASVQLTFVSVMVGLVLADLVAKMRADLTGLPLTIMTLIFWGEALGILASAIGNFTLFTLVAITAGRIPTMGLSVISLLVPLVLLVANSFVADPVLWRFFLSGAAFLVVAVYVSDSLIGAQAREPGYAAMARMGGWAPSRMVLIGSIALYFIAAGLGLAGLLPELLALALTWGAGPASLLHQHFLYKEWHQALALIEDQP